LPGAFTPGCSKKHLPSFLESTEKLKEKNIKKVFCISINDPFVMEAWGKNYNLKDELTLLADANGDFTKSIGAEFIWRGWGLRSKRYTMLLEAGVVKKLVEEEGKCELTAAENFLKGI
jgi:peroxiredoxin